MSKIVVIYSGGMDSRTVLEWALHNYNQVFALSMFYGQRHKKELLYAKKVCDQKNIPHKIIDISFMREIANNSALTSDVIGVPEGHYEEESMNVTVVPNRNMILLSIAYSYALNIGVEEVAYGAHSGDHHIYNDCRPAFIAGMSKMGGLIDDRGIILRVPFVDGNKKTIIEYGLERGIDYADTWTCYNGKEKPCGKCGACQERAEAFSSVGLEDPLLE